MEITDLENLTSTFKQYCDIGNFEEIAANAKAIKARIDEAFEKSKLINNREGMVDYDEPSDYSTIP